MFPIDSGRFFASYATDEADSVATGHAEHAFLHALNVVAWADDREPGVREDIENEGKGLQ